MYSIIYKTIYNTKHLCCGSECIQSASCPVLGHDSGNILVHERIPARLEFPRIKAEQEAISLWQHCTFGLDLILNLVRRLVASTAHYTPQS